MASKLDKMDFTQFVKYLKERDIDYTLTQETDIDVWFTVLTIVAPISNKLKPRYFDNDGGGQLF